MDLDTVTDGLQGFWTVFFQGIWIGFSRDLGASSLGLGFGFLDVSGRFELQGFGLVRIF